MEVFRNDVKSGIFIVGAVVLFLLGLFQVGGLMDRLNAGKQVVLIFDNSFRVTEGTEVLYLGKKVGRVDEIMFNKEATGVEILCDIDIDTTLYEGTTARIDDKSMLGGKLIELYPPDNLSADLAKLEEGARIPGMPAAGLSQMIATMSSMLVELEGKAGELFDQLNGVLVELNATVVNTNSQISSAGELLPKVDQALDRFASLAGTLDQEVKTVTGKVSGSIDTLVPEAQKTLQNVQTLTARLNGDIDDIKKDLQGVMNGTEQLLTNTDNLILDNRRELEQTLITLRQTLANLEVFTQRIAEKPSSLIMSRKQPLPEPASDEERRQRELRESGMIDRKGSGGDQ